MSLKVRFTSLDAYRLNKVTVTDRVLGHGSYATVLELEYMGLKCAGKKIHEVLLNDTIHKFDEECRLLSQVRHPNVVQFLGVYFQDSMAAPILVMEFLPTNLTSCIDRYNILPKEISYSILHDVSLGLCYLHNQTPPIIHRDLSSNNVLLTPNMTAKISDLGVARILNLTPLQVSRMTETLGTPAYMPPEVMVAKPKYDTSIDAFSYGILMIHIFSGSWPNPQVGPVHTEHGKLIAVSEADRRRVFLEIIGNDHPLMDLILKCISNDPQERLHASEIVARLASMVINFQISFTNLLEMARFIESQSEEKLHLKMESEIDGKRKDEQICHLMKETQQNAHKMDDIKMSHSIETDMLKLQIKALDSQKEWLKNECESKIKELKSKVAHYEARLKGNMRKLQEERRVNEKLRCEISVLQQTKSELEADNSVKDNIIQIGKIAMKRKDDEIELKTITLNEKDNMLSQFSEQIDKMKDYLTTKQRDIQACINWQRCADLPISLGGGKAAVVSGMVYCGGGLTDSDNNDYTVYCYDPSQDNWTTLPPLPVKYFSLDRVNGKLVAVGGLKKGNACCSSNSELFTYSERSKKWKPTIPPMPTARYYPGVFSCQSALVVAGGCTSFRNYIDTVEILKLDTLQWFKTDPLPVACRIVSPVIIGNTCYALGGYKWPSSINPALCASVDDLLHNAVVVDKSYHGVVSSCFPAWRTLTKTTNYEAAIAVLSGKLLAIGGTESSQGGAAKKEICMYSSSFNSWIYVDDLPEPRHDTAVTTLSSTEILVIGGSRDVRENTVYKGTLILK